MQPQNWPDAYIELTGDVITFKNDPIILNVKKLENVSETETGFVSGAELTIYEVITEGMQSREKEITSWVTKEAAEKLYAKLDLNKNYILRETKVPAGYNTPGDIQFSIASDGSLKTAVKNKENDTTLVMKNEPNAISVIAVDEDNANARLAGVTFELSGPNMAPIKWTTQDKNFEKVIRKQLSGGGIYTLTVKSKPAGYNHPEKTVYILKPNGKLAVNTVPETAVENNRIIIPFKRDKGSMQLQKVDGVSKHEYLSDTEFKLEKYVNGEWKLFPVRWYRWHN